jgi:hypothetical protein
MIENGAPVIEIRDPALDGPAIARLVQEQAARRRAQDAQSVDRATVIPGPLQPGSATASSDAMAGFPGLSESLAELIGRSQLEEHDFQSAVPLLGPVIVAVRRIWNWMSTKWYVRPLMAQQSDLNSRSARVVSDLAQWHELDARRLEQLEARLAELEARLAGMEKTEDAS